MEQRRSVQRRAAGLHPLQIQDVVDQADQPLGIGGGDPQQVLRLGVYIAEQARGEQAERAADAGERRAQLMRDGGDELILDRVQVGTLGQFVLLLLGVSRLRWSASVSCSMASFCWRLRVASRSVKTPARPTVNNSKPDNR